MAEVRILVMVEISTNLISAMPRGRAILERQFGNYFESREKLSAATRLIEMPWRLPPHRFAASANPWIDPEPGLC
jgi:hypothetical protein